jgi:hypothetical protein
LGPLLPCCGGLVRGGRGGWFINFGWPYNLRANDLPEFSGVERRIIATSFRASNPIRGLAIERFGGFSASEPITQRLLEIQSSWQFESVSMGLVASVG